MLRETDADLAPRGVSETKLGEVKELNTLTQLAQQQGVPLARVNGGNAAVKDEARLAFAEIAAKIIERTAESVGKAKRGTRVD